MPAASAGTAAAAPTEDSVEDSAWREGFAGKRASSAALVAWELVKDDALASLEGGLAPAVPSLALL